MELEKLIKQNMKTMILKGILVWFTVFLSLIFLLSLEGLIENNCYKEVGIFVVLLGIMWYLVKKKVSLKDLEKITGITLNED